MLCFSLNIENDKFEQFYMLEHTKVIFTPVSQLLGSSTVSNEVAALTYNL